ncbi:hypothetical protein DPMN_193255 [Dreissena polymorpha]|uniref:Uncharacterized protein n=1 Tax=Dreissena polymorpha TaxID=45954 RepID=A0A9D3Y482_DREPO|nr:hypothetical protein DPMN_193255 [Dreissena polymorpha]
MWGGLGRSMSGDRIMKDFLADTHKGENSGSAPAMSTSIAQILPNIVNKVLKVYLWGFVSSTSHFKPKWPRIELMLEKALKNDSSCVVWYSMPFDSHPDVSFSKHYKPTRQTPLKSMSMAIPTPSFTNTTTRSRNSARRHLASA